MNKSRRALGNKCCCELNETHTKIFPLNSDAANSAFASSEPDRRAASPSRLVTCTSSPQSADARLFEKFNLLALFCCSHFAAALVKQLEGLIKSQIRIKKEKRKQDGGEIIKHEDETAEAGETGIRVPRLAPGI